MKEWVFEKLSQNQSFNQLVEKTRYILTGQITKELQGIYESKGQVFLDAYKAELEPRLLRTQWLWVKNSRFPFQKWSKIKSEIIKVLRNEDKLNKVPVEVIKAQINVLDACVEVITDYISLKDKKPHWIKNPQGGWMRHPRP